MTLTPLINIEVRRVGGVEKKIESFFKNVVDCNSMKYLMTAANFQK